MPWFGLSVTLSAFLLFALQPMMGKALLPWFGGVPAVWTTCMLFFQLVLLGGYTWSHGLQRFSPRRQVLAHGALLVAASAAVVATAITWSTPLLPDPSWRPLDSARPAEHALLILIASVGLPTLAIGATGPLLQSWFTRAKPGASPWRLYALSNAGSLSALVAYPFLIEPWLPLPRQAWAWAVGFAFLALAVLTSARPLLAMRTRPVPTEVAETPTREVLAWISLAALPSLLLLAITNHLCQEVAPVPLLWVLPLALYLLSMILCFDSDRWYARARFVPATAVLLVLSGALRLSRAPVVVQVAVFGALLFCACMLCHGELARRRPASSALTRFYLSMAFGGALGGVGVAVVAPLLFSSFFELDAGLLLVTGISVYLLRSGAGLPGGSALWGRRAANALAFAMGLLAMAGGMLVRSGLTSARSFFGVVRVVRDRLGPDHASRIALLHGATAHGFQIESPTYRRTPTAYFTSHSGVGLALSQNPQRRAGGPISVGVVGLGIGTLAAYEQPGDTFRFYEVAPDVIRLAKDARYFTYLSDARGQSEVVEGDGRLAIERDANRLFDVLVLDAFSSDSVPAHLLTREAFALYLSRLKQTDSLIAVNVINRTLDLASLVTATAHAAGLASVHIQAQPSGGETDPIELRSDWMVLSRDPGALRALRPGLEVAMPDSRAGPQPWTDDFSNLAALLRKPGDPAPP